MVKERLLLTTTLSPGDILTLTAAVRDLYRTHGDKYLINVQTSVMEIWENNPYLDRSITKHNADRVIEMHYNTAINKCNQDRNTHFINGYRIWLEEHLGIQIPLLEFKTDVHLTAAERNPANNLVKTDKPYWVMFAGGKLDYTAKWWHKDKFRQVVEMLQDEVTFVQVGETGNGKYNPTIPGAVQLIGKTTMRNLITLIAHSHGVLCPVTCGLHLASAFDKPCVVLGGGREGWWWEQYPNQQYLHSIGGNLECCSGGSCWRSHVDISYVGVVNDKGEPNSLEERKSKVCKYVVDYGGQLQPVCLDAITAERVVEEIRTYQKETPYVSAEETKDFVPYNTSPAVVDEMLGGPDKRMAVAVCLFGDDDGSPLPTICNKLGDGLYEEIPTLNYAMVQRRCIRSILENTDLSKINLYIGCNQVGEQVVDWINTSVRDQLSAHGAVLKVIDHNENIHKYPMMRELFAELRDEEWVTWFDDDSYVTSDMWLRRVAGAANTSNAGVLGKIYNIRSIKGQWDWVKAASWYRGVAPVSFKKRMGKQYPVYQFCTGGFNVIRKSVITMLDWPDPRLDHNGGDTTFGEACRQNGVELYDLFKAGNIGIVISGAQRRGYFEAPAGALCREVAMKG